MKVKHKYTMKKLEENPENYPCMPKHTGGMSGIEEIFICGTNGNIRYGRESPACWMNIRGDETVVTAEGVFRGEGNQDRFALAKLCADQLSQTEKAFWHAPHLEAAMSILNAL